MNINQSGRGKVTIDGRDFVGGSVIINGDKVVVDGVEQTGSLVGPISVTVHGNVQLLESASGRISITGTAGNVKTASGDVTCGDVQGSITTVSGDIECGRVGGSISTVSGDIEHR